MDVQHISVKWFIALFRILRCRLQWTSGLVPMNYYPMIRRTSCATKDSVSKLHQILILNENYTIRLLVIFGTERINVESIQKTDCENLIEYSISWICLLLLVLLFP